jgi:DNA-binding IclR family transcriptional regulator
LRDIVVTSVERLLIILNLFTPQKPVWTLEEMASHVNFSRSSMYRYVGELTDSGFLMALGRGSFTLGPRIIELDRQIRVCDPLLAASKEVMRRASRNLPGGVLILSSLYGDRIICTHQEPEPSPLPISYSRGRTLPLFTSSTSRVILANLPHRTLVRIFLQHRADIAAAGLGGEWDQFKQRLREIRREGLYVTRSAVDAGMLCVASAIFSAPKSVIGALCFVETDTGQDVAPAVKEGLREATAEISRGVTSMLSLTTPSSPSYVPAVPQLEEAVGM